MATDILIYQADFVPVGQDQVAHVEVTREVARRFNHFYPGPDGAAHILPEPQVLLTPSPKLPGTDGRKMSKSYGNTITAHRSGAGGAAEAEDHGDRSGAGPAQRSG
jgi:tryptophanyl-tRNA synthetase